MDIKKEIKILREQAASDTRTGYPDLAAYRNQMADWLSELLLFKEKVITCSNCKYAIEGKKINDDLSFYICEINKNKILSKEDYCSMGEKK